MWFGVLGPLAVSDDTGERLAPSAKSRYLLAILLARANDVVSTDRLVEVLWPDKDPRAARTNLQVSVHRLWRLLGESHIVRSDLGYRLVVGNGELDVHRFEELMAQGAHHEALAQWRGEAYADVGDVEIVREEAARLAQLRVSVLEERIEQDLEHGKSAYLIPELTALVAQHPLRERFRGLLMTALYRAGRVPEALEVYREARQQLVDELGLEPSRSLRTLEQAILSEDPSLDSSHPRTAGPAAPAELPPETGTFTGRLHDLERVNAVLSRQENDAVPVVAITGPGGIGKSAMAARTARSIAEQYPDGQVYVNLQGATPGLRPLAPEEALGRLLRSLGSTDIAPPRDVGEASGRLRTLTSGRKILMVLDDAVDDAQVRPLLPGGSQSGVLVTSRSALTSLEGVAQYRLHTLSEDEGTALLARVAEQERLAAEPAAAAELAKLCDYLPLALCIAGAKLASRPNWGVRALVDRMADEQQRLNELESADRAVRASFAASYDDLDDEPARLFRLLGPLDSPDIGLPVAAALADRSERQAEVLLDQLQDAQLTDSPSPERYRLHDLLRLFAREHSQALESEQQREAAVRRALHCYVATGLNAQSIDSSDNWRRGFVPHQLTHPGIALSDETEVGSWISAEIKNLVAAGRQAAALPTSEPLLGAAFAAALFTPLNTRGRWYELRTLLEIGLRSAEANGLPDHAALMRNDFGWITALLGQEGDALAHVQAALEHWRKSGSRRGEATTLRVHARVLSQLGRDEEALTYARSAAELYREVGSIPGHVDCLLAIGLLSARLGDVDHAIAAHEEGIVIGEREGLVWHTGALTGNLADLRRRVGEYAQAAATFERALDIDRKTGNTDTYFEAEHLWGLARTMHAQGYDDVARNCWDRAAAILRELRLIDAEQFAVITATSVPETPEVIARQL